MEVMTGKKKKNKKKKKSGKDTQRKWNFSINSFFVEIRKNREDKEGRIDVRFTGNASQFFLFFSKHRLIRDGFDRVN